MAAPTFTLPATRLRRFCTSKAGGTQLRCKQRGAFRFLVPDFRELPDFARDVAEMLRFGVDVIADFGVVGGREESGEKEKGEECFHILTVYSGTPPSRSRLGSVRRRSGRRLGRGGRWCRRGIRLTRCRSRGWVWESGCGSAPCTPA